MARAGKDPQRIAQDWQEELEKFQQLRKKYLLYYQVEPKPWYSRLN